MPGSKAQREKQAERKEPWSRFSLRSLRGAGLAVLGLLLFGWALRAVPLGETLAVLRRLQVWQVLAWLTLNGVALLTLNGRWWAILHGLGYPIPSLRLVRYRLAAFGLSYFTPGPQFGGEPLQIYLIERDYQVPRPVALAALALDKSLELVVNFAFLALGVAVVGRMGLLGTSALNRVAFGTVFLLAIPFAYLFAILTGQHPLSRLLAFFSPHLAAVARESESRATAFCHRAPGAFGFACVVSVVSWGVLIAEYWLLLAFLGLELSLAQTVAALTAVRLAFLLPSPGGLGTLEASQLLVFSALGLDPAVGLSASLLIRLRDVCLAGFGLWWGTRRVRNE